MIVQVRICVPGELSGVVLESCTNHVGVSEVALAKASSVTPPYLSQEKISASPKC